jgi:inner membrane protein involved in colicin E2 resistance
MIVVVANAFIGYWLGARGTNWRHALTEFLGMGVVNVGVVGVAWLLLRRSDEPLAVGQTLFLVALLTLIVTLYDRYRLMRLPAASLIPGRPRVTP